MEIARGWRITLFVTEFNMQDGGIKSFVVKKSTLICVDNYCEFMFFLLLQKF